MKRKLTKTEVIEVLDKETGEITIENTKSKPFLIDKEPDYIKLYIENISRLKDIPAGMNKVLFEIINIVKLQWYCYGLYAY